MTNIELNAKITERELLVAHLKDLKALVDEIETSIKDEMDSRMVDEIDTGMHKIFYKPIASKSVDTKALKEAGLYDTYAKETIKMYFKIN